MTVVSEMIVNFLRPGAGITHFFSQRLLFSVYIRETAPSGLTSAVSRNMKSIF